MLKCSPEVFAKCPNRLYCGSYPSECSFTEGSDCDKFNRQVEDGPKTNADRIRAMSDDELAEAFYNLVDNIQTGTMNDLSDLYCDGKNGCIDKDGNITCTPEMEKACVLRWLRSPAKEEKRREK